MRSRSICSLLVGVSLLLWAGLAVRCASASPVGSERNKTFQKYVEIPGASTVGSETCTSCHEATSKNFQHAFHKQQGLQCEDCHGNGSLHVEGGGDVGKIVSFAKRPAQAANGVCLGCHSRDEKARHWSSGSHAASHVRCVDCHQVHDRALRSANESRISFDTSTRGAFIAGSVSPETNVILRPRSATTDACLKCHQTEGAQLSMPYHHPLREGKMSCVDCHDPHGGPGGNNLRTANANQLCLSCHAQYRGPFAYQHPPVTENCMICHTAHGSPNTNLLNVSEPALCLQCHAGHHNGAGLPLPDRCTNCHGSIHGTDTPTPSGGSRFVDKGPSEAALRASLGSAATAGLVASHPATSVSMLRAVPSHVPTYATGMASGTLGMLSSGSLAPLSGASLWTVGGDPAGAEAGPGNAYYSLTPGEYRFVNGSGYLGRVGEYDSLQNSAGADAVSVYVSPESHLTVVSRANVVTGDDFSAVSQLTVGQRLQVGFDMRSFVQQQDHYPFYAFPVQDVDQANCGGPCDTSTDLIPSHATFGAKRRLGNAYARLKVPKLPVHIFVNGDWQARAGLSQLAYLDENTLPITAATPCGTLCHFQSGGSLNSQLQQVNYTTRSIGGGGDVDLGPVRLTYQHKFSSFNDRLVFPTGVFGPFTPGDEFLPRPTPPGVVVPVPPDVAAGNYPIDIPAPNQFSSDSLGLNWTASPRLAFNGHVSYARLRDMLTHYPQNSFDSDETLNWRPLDRLRVTADYHQHNLLNKFTPFYSFYGNVSYHEHWEGLRFDYELPKSLDVEAYYRRTGITRSNALLWPQVYSGDNTDLLINNGVSAVVPSSFSNTTGLALRYHDRGYWSARAGYEWTGTHHPGYLVVPQSNNRTFADLWFTPTQRLTLTNDVSIILQNAFPAIPLLRPDGTGLPGNFQRRNRFYVDTLSATLRLVPAWNLGLGYSYQQNNLTTYMAFQNDSGAGYVVDEPAVPYKQITQVYWGESTYTFKQRLGLNLRLTYNSSRSGMRPDVNPADVALLGNQALLPVDPALFSQALANVQFAATQISQVIVPQWIGQSKAYYRFPNRFEGGLIFYYGSYRDERTCGPISFCSSLTGTLNPSLNGVLRTFNLYVGRSW